MSELPLAWTLPYLMDETAAVRQYIDPGRTFHIGFVYSSTCTGLCKLASILYINASSFSSFSCLGNMTRHWTIWRGNIRLILCEVWMKNTALEDNAACIYLNSLCECAGDGSVIQCSLTGNTSIAAAEQMPLSLRDPTVMNCALICYNFIFLWLPAGTVHTVKWDKNNGLAKQGRK